MASKDEGLTGTLLRELERSIEQAGEFSQAWGVAATKTWTHGIRATAEAFDAATKDEPKTVGTTGGIQRLGNRLRTFARHASIGYSAALRDGVSLYADTLKKSGTGVRSASPKPREAKRTARGKVKP